MGVHGIRTHLQTSIDSLFVLIILASFQLIVTISELPTIKSYNHHSKVSRYLHIMNAELIQTIQGELPYQSAIYVIFAVREKRIHVMSQDVNSKYAIVDSLLSCQDSIQRRGHIERFFHESIINDGSDCAGFFLGVSPGRLLELLSTDNSRAILCNCEIRNTDGNTVVVPYTRYHIPGSLISSHLGPTPITEDEEKVYGSLKYHSRFGDGDLGVSLPLYASFYVFAKIDMTGFIHEHEFSEDEFLPETFLSSNLNADERERLRNCAVDLVQQTHQHAPSYDQFPPQVARIISASSSESWPIQFHDHDTVT